MQIDLISDISSVLHIYISWQHMRELRKSMILIPCWHHLIKSVFGACRWA